MKPPVPSESWPGIAGEEVQPDGGQRVDQERDQDRLQPVLARDQRRHDRADHGGTSEPAVLDDREDRLVAAYVVLNCPASR